MSVSQFGDGTESLVWAKMKGFSPWPGRISAISPPELGKAPKGRGPVKCIFFFGTRNYAWIEEANIKNYLEYKEQLIKSSKSAAFKEAIQKMDEFISDPVKFKANAMALETESGDQSRENNKAKEVSAFDKLVNNSTDDSVATDALLPSPTGPAPKRVPKKKVARAASLPQFKVSKDKSSKPSKQLKSILVKNKNDLSGGPPSKRNRFNDEDVLIVNDKKHDLPIIPRRSDAANQLLNRPLLCTRPEPPEIDMENVSQTLKSKNINPSPLRFGFLGLGIMGCGIVKNLINSGHKVVVWNRTLSKCRKFSDAGAEVAPTPCDVIDRVDITFSCVSDPIAAKQMVFGNCGVLSSNAITEGKGYVEMTSIDAETSQDIADGITSKGGRYLEAQIQGSKNQAEEGTLIILAAGERSLFEECQTCFEAMGKNSFYLGEVGNASKMNLVLQMMAGVTMATLAEGLSLASKAGLQQKDVLEVLELTNMSSQLMLEKGNAMVKGEFVTHQPLTHVQKDLRLTLGMAEILEHPLPITATTNEIYKHAKRLGYAEHDSSAIYIRSKF